MTPYLGSPRNQASDFSQQLILNEKKPQEMIVVKEEDFRMDSAKNSISSSSSSSMQKVLKKDVGPFQLAESQSEKSNQEFEINEKDDKD